MPTPQSNAPEVLDLTHVRQLEGLLVGGNRSLFRDLAALFCREMPPRLEQMRIKLTERDRAQLSRLAHAMVGSAASIGGRQLQAALRGLEAAAGTDDWVAIEQAHHGVEQAWLALSNALNARISSLP